MLVLYCSVYMYQFLLFLNLVNLKEKRVNKEAKENNWYKNTVSEQREYQVGTAGSQRMFDQKVEKIEISFNQDP